MTANHPPRFAAWLLQHLGCSVDNDAVLGDLAERFREGKTSAWYWMQTLTAIAVSTFEDIHARKVLALRAVLAGCFVQISIQVLMTRYFPLVPYWVPLGWWGTGFESIVGSAIALFLGIAVGWTIVRLYQGRRAILLSYLLIVQLLGGLASAVAGISFAFYLTASISLTLGILFGGLWMGSEGRATRTVAWLRIVAWRYLSMDALIMTFGVMGVLAVVWLIEWFADIL
jgi:hypothetical protein